MEPRDKTPLMAAVLVLPLLAIVARSAFKVSVPVPVVTVPPFTKVNALIVDTAVFANASVAPPLICTFWVLSWLAGTAPMALTSTVPPLIVTGPARPSPELDIDSVSVPPFTVVKPE